MKAVVDFIRYLVFVATFIVLLLSLDYLCGWLMFRIFSTTIDIFKGISLLWIVLLFVFAGGIISVLWNLIWGLFSFLAVSLASLASTISPLGKLNMYTVFILLFINWFYILYHLWLVLYDHPLGFIGASLGVSFWYISFSFSIIGGAERNF